MTSELTAKRVLVVEDELLISMVIEDILADEGCQVIGPFTNLPDALAAAQRGGFDLALLDVNLRGEKVYPVAEILAEQGVPFMFLSGYGKDAIPGGHPDWRACGKPFTAAELTRRLSEVLSGKT
jgi:DNA-binding response OmpR family regulator